MAGLGGVYLPKEAELANETPTVLVAEDEVIVRMEIADVLRSAGYEVIEADNADEALAVLRCGAMPDLLLTDLHMPGAHDGLELAHIVRDAYPKTKIVLVSAQPPHADDAALDAMVQKPYEPAALLATIAALLSPGAVSDQGTVLGDS